MGAEGVCADDPVLLSCRHLAEAVERFDEAVCAALRVGRSDLRALNLLADGPLTATALARGLGLTRPAVTALVDRLVGAGFVERVAVPGDRRSTAVAAQPTIAEAFARVYGPLGERVGAAVDGLPAPERAVMGAALDALTDAFRAAGDHVATGDQPTEEPETGPDAPTAPADSARTEDPELVQKS